ncbi:MAG: hypothetical protein ABI769_11160 [Pseudomonadota bacterium]
MACTQCAGAHQHNEVASTLERIRYFPRQLLTADDMRTEQEYFRAKMRRHNRMLHGWGVVCGLVVTRQDAQTVDVSAGFALGPYGDEIEVEHAEAVDITHCTQPGSEVCVHRDGAPPAEPGPVYIKIRYVECPSRPMRTLPAGCGCDESACEYSRLRDGYEIRCFRAPEKEEPLPTYTVDALLPACRPLSVSPWLTLARVTPNAAQLVVTYAERRVVLHTPSLSVS